MRHIAVIDIGKTNAKLLAIDLSTGMERIVARRPNEVVSSAPYPHFDVEALWSFLLAALGELGRSQQVDAISITTHGASAALVDAAGRLALPVLDYEHPGPDDLSADYDAQRPPFSETGAPRLPGGLNLGAQLFWQAQRFPAAFAETRHILTYPQYWAFRLTGIAASEATSLGCHTDLWNPFGRSFSSLVERMGWSALFPPLHPAGAVLGPILPDIARTTGLPAATPVLCGIHDSNASLVPWLGRKDPCSVLSTGTWMIVMSLGGGTVTLDARRDTLINVNARGAPVPTARFMAGREFDELTRGQTPAASEATERMVLASQVMVLPSLHPTTGPFPGQVASWTPTEPEDAGARVAAASFYVALMGAACLSLIGAEGEIIVEGPMGGNRAFARMLATATGRDVLLAGQGAGTGLGAALLAGPLTAPRAAPERIRPETEPVWKDYAALWQARVAARQSSS
ncbi:MAG: FGGY-family carbohydrate kinase [Tabrizicola sp.]|nr:FGGY-family carbohydrate kinase [Tabrizicola sp.]